MEYSCYYLLPRNSYVRKQNAFFLSLPVFYLYVSFIPSERLLSSSLESSDGVPWGAQNAPGASGPASSAQGCAAPPSSLLAARRSQQPPSDAVCEPVLLFLVYKLFTLKGQAASKDLQQLKKTCICKMKLFKISHTCIVLTEDVQMYMYVSMHTHLHTQNECLHVCVHSHI